MSGLWTDAPSATVGLVSGHPARLTFAEIRSVPLGLVVVTWYPGVSL